MAREGPATPTVSTFIVTNSLKKEAPSIAAVPPPTSSGTGFHVLSFARIVSSCSWRLNSCHVLETHSWNAITWCSSPCDVRCSITGLTRSCSWGYFVQELPEHIRQVQKTSRNVKIITLLRVIPTMTFQNSHVRFYVSLIVSGEGRQTTHLLKCVRLLSTSQTDCRQSSDILSDISFDILSDISSDIVSDILSGISPGILSGILSDISYDILSGTSCDTFSDISSNILSDIISDISCHILSDISSERYSFWHIFWISFDILSSPLTLFLTFFLAYLLTFCLAHLLTLFLTFFLTYLLTFFTFFLNSVCPSCFCDLHLFFIVFKFSRS